MSTPASWVPGSRGSGYDVDHLPYGVFGLRAEGPASRRRIGVRIGDHVLDLAAAVRHERWAGHVGGGTLNPLMAAGRATWDEVRRWLQATLVDHDSAAQHVSEHLVRLEDVVLHLPFDVADYVDFYCSLDHASNVGRLFRPDAEPLLPNWRHLPVAYHGRAGTVVVSGTDVVRPTGQRKAPDDPAPSYGLSTRLDVEAEVGFVVGTPSRLGEAVPTSAFADHVFGVVLLNDWSARDIQAWEYVPLGPFLGKSFATSVSAWVTPLAALEPARVPLPGQDPPPLPYLQVEEPAGYDLALEVEVDGEVVSRPPYRTTYWGPAQMLAHLTSNGASLRTGDLFASGTVSGPEREQVGSFLELSWGGREPWSLGGEERTFLRDGDEVVLRARAGTVSLGEVRGRILPPASRPRFVEFGKES
ncbi:fumarylacetoacetase [Mumia zhuanghuii]|uniref:fumarylacetoacetase n=2 Tax=Mumia TaxID=1546255 RepID=A0ABW1QMH7_9ACTN|nr:MULTISPECIES: fumarylacetoacetase [Mumia]KAA1425188.1 fumarylacetoacetase [Mumia zhuanghuii]